MGGTLRRAATCVRASVVISRIRGQNTGRDHSPPGAGPCPGERRRPAGGHDDEQREPGRPGRRVALPPAGQGRRQSRHRVDGDRPDHPSPQHRGGGGGGDRRGAPGRQGDPPLLRAVGQPDGRSLGLPACRCTRHHHVGPRRERLALLRVRRGRRHRARTARDQPHAAPRQCDHHRRDAGFRRPADRARLLLGRPHDDGGPVQRRGFRHGRRRHRRGRGGHAARDPSPRCGRHHLHHPERGDTSARQPLPGLGARRSST